MATFGNVLDWSRILAPLWTLGELGKERIGNWINWSLEVTWAAKYGLSQLYSLANDYKDHLIFINFGIKKFTPQEKKL